MFGFFMVEMKCEGCYNYRGGSEEVEERLFFIVEIREEFGIFCFFLYECYNC